MLYIPVLSSRNEGSGHQDQHVPFQVHEYGGGPCLRPARQSPLASKSASGILPELDPGYPPLVDLDDPFQSDDGGIPGRDRAAAGDGVEPKREILLPVARKVDGVLDQRRERRDGLPLYLDETVPPLADQSVEDGTVKNRFVSPMLDAADDFTARVAG